MSSKNIAYVREKRVAALLNDMVVHLLASHPTDALGSLITYLERRQPDDDSGAKKETEQPKAVEQKPAVDDEGRKDKAATPIQPAPPAAPKDNSAARPTAGTPTTKPAQDEATAKSEPSSQDAKAAAPAADGAAQATAATGKEEDAPLVAPSEIDAMLKELAASEESLGGLLDALMADNSLSTADRAAASEARAHCNEMRKYTAYSTERNDELSLALDRVRSSMSDEEFFTATGFRLIHQIDANERGVRAAFRELGIDLSALKGADASLAQKAITAHEELLGLLDAVEGKQLEIAVAANKGAINASVQQYFDDLSSNISLTYSELKKNAKALKERAPDAASGAAGRQAEKMTLSEQADTLLQGIRAEQANFENMVAAVLSGDDAELKKAVEDAMVKSNEIQRDATIAMSRNNQAVMGTPGSYNETREQLHALNAEIASKLLLFSQSHAAAVSRIASAVTSRASEQAAAIGVALNEGLKGSTDDHAKEALKAQADLEGLVSDIAASQQAIQQHVLAKTAAPPA